MIAFSGGTSLEGTLASTTRGGCCIDFKLMNNIIQLHPKDMDVVVQPCVGYEELNRQLAEKGLFFPPDPGPGAQIGGMVAQGCSGTNAYRYGTMKDWVLGLTVVLADGTVVKTRNRPRKSSAGYNLTQLMVGSEGTLGLVTEASLKLTCVPENIRVAVLAFPSSHDAVETAVEVVQNDMPVAPMELLCEVTMKAINQSGYCDKVYRETPTLFMKFSGHSEQAVEEQINRVQAFAKKNSCKSFQLSMNDNKAANLWSARKTALWSLLAMKEDPKDKFISADAAVPISRLADIVKDTRKRLDASGLVGSCLGHVGDGKVSPPLKEK
jgi:D-lactate dehydrogenase (cytochrome)